MINQKGEQLHGKISAFNINLRVTNESWKGIILN